MLLPGGCVRVPRLIGNEACGECLPQRLGIYPLAPVVKGLLGLVAVVAVVAGYVYHESDHSASASTVSQVIGADYCDKSSFQEINRLDGSKARIYDCQLNGRQRCVTYVNGIATDQTATVRLLFQSTLGSGKPPCLS